MQSELTCTYVLYRSSMSKLFMSRCSFFLHNSQVVMASRLVPAHKKQDKQEQKRYVSMLGGGILRGFWRFCRSPEWILAQSHLLIQSWWTNCRLPVQWQGCRSGLDSESSPIWQIRHRSPSSSSDSSSSSLKGAI